MPFQTRRFQLVCILTFFLLAILYTLSRKNFAGVESTLRFGAKHEEEIVPLPLSPPEDDGVFRWKDRPQRHPVDLMKGLPAGRALNIPKIQYDFSSREASDSKNVRLARLQSVKNAFVHTWDGYKSHAWMKDEVSPLSGGSRDSFGGWAATLVDSLDTLWIVGLRDDFDKAVAEIKTIDFTISTEEEINIFETTIRYLGGFLSAYDLSGQHVLLEKAIELGDMIYAAFDTPNRMPVTRWKWKAAQAGEAQEAGGSVLVAEIGSLSLEFTRLSQLSDDPRYYDAVQRITGHFVTQQDRTKLPGMFPVVVNARDTDFTGESTFSLGAWADSFYEYLPKEYMLLGGLSNDYQMLYEGSIDAAKKHHFFRPLNPQNLDILIAGGVQMNDGKAEIDPQGQHLVCFAGGMIAMGAKIFERDDLDIGRKLVDGCVWAYESFDSGIMPETFHAIPCTDSCQWSETKWHDGIMNRTSDVQRDARTRIEQDRLPPGFTDIPDRRYILRPEAIESVFILYRITGDKTLQDKAWKMFQAIEKHARTDIAYAALDDITLPQPPKADRMESFWPAETLKYFYLIFSEPDVISLDDYVFNTEAHPLKRPKADTVLR